MCMCSAVCLHVCVRVAICAFVCVCVQALQARERFVVASALPFMRHTQRRRVHVRGRVRARACACKCTCVHACGAPYGWPCGAPQGPCCGPTSPHTAFPSSCMRAPSLARSCVCAGGGMRPGQTRALATVLALLLSTPTPSSHTHLKLGWMTVAKLPSRHRGDQAAAQKDFTRFLASNLMKFKLVRNKFKARRRSGTSSKRQPGACRCSTTGSHARRPRRARIVAQFEESPRGIALSMEDAFCFIPKPIMGTQQYCSSSLLHVCA